MGARLSKIHPSADVKKPIENNKERRSRYQLHSENQRYRLYRRFTNNVNIATTWQQFASQITDKERRKSIHGYRRIEI